MTPLYIQLGKYRMRASHRRQRGVVLVITLLATIFLAALVFYVFNLGHGVQSRIDTQNAADAAAEAGAGWMARSMNTVAMNNVAMTRQLALVNVLDSMPKAVAFTLEDQRAMREAVRDQRNRGVGSDQWVGPDLAMIEADLDDQILMLEEMDDYFNSFDVRELTFYHAPGGGQGRLWQAMEALDAFNQATVESMDQIAAVAAMEAARANMRPGDEEPGEAMLLRNAPATTWQRGRFQDFRGPLTTGLTQRAELAAAGSDWHKYRGPFDALFGWRHFQDRKERGDPPSNPVSSGFSSAWSERVQGSAGAVISREIISYSPYGMHTWLAYRFRWLNHVPDDMRHANPLGSEGPLRYSGFRLHRSRIADIKLGFSPLREQLGRRVVDPEWIGFAEARAILEADEDEEVPEIHEYRFIELTYTQLLTPTGSQPPELESWSINIRPGLQPPGLSRRRAYMWRDEQIEQPPELAQQGQSLRRMHYYIFGGANIGERVSVRNPYNTSMWQDMPAPIEFTGDSARPDLLPDDGLRFMAVARQPRRSPMWASAFDRDAPQSHQFAIAQAHVFNNHSWDMWTQMWHAQLEPVQNYDEWLVMLEDMPGQTIVDPWTLEPAAIEEIYRDMQSVRELAPLMLNH